MNEGIIARITLWLEIYQGECEERDLLSDALEEIERLQLENNQLHTECGHLRADAVEARDEIERLRQQLEKFEELRAAIERMRSAIYECGESPMEQRVQIDPVQYLRTRYVSVTDHNKTYDVFNAEIERLRCALAACSSVAAGQFHAFSQDRFEAIQEIVRKAFMREVDDE